MRRVSSPCCVVVGSVYAPTASLALHPTVLASSSSPPPHLATTTTRRVLGSLPLCRPSASNAMSSSSMCTPLRTIIVPNQLKAYGDTFSPSKGDRSDHLAGDAVLQKVTNNSKSLLTRVKTSTVDSFDNMGLSLEVRQGLSAMEIVTPSPIQQSSVTPILQKKDVLIASPHGEGKTVAMLAPLYSNMLKDRDVYQIPLRERRPRMILMAPTRETILQLHHTCRQFDAATGLHSVSFVSGKRVNFKLKRLLKNEMPDVLIMHPRAVLKLIRKRRLFLDDLRYVAVDEADTMLSSKQDHDAVKLAVKIQHRKMYKHLWPVQTQFVFATSFITRKLEHIVAKKFPEMVPCFRRNAMHSPSKSLVHKFYPTVQTHKMDLLVYLLKKHGNEPRAVDTDEDERRVAEEGQFVGLESAPEKAHWGGGTSFASTLQQQQQNMKRVQNLRPPPPPSRKPTTQDDTLMTTTAITQQQDLFDLKNEKNDHELFADEEEDHASLATRDDHNALSTLVEQQQQHPTKEERYVLEGARPTRWDHLTTMAAPFQSHVPRSVFAEGKRVLVFLHDIDSCTAIYHHLKNRGFSCALLHAALPNHVRQQMFHRFASGQCNILVATDLASRGLDLPVDVVINFTMPTNSVQYLSRAGRTGRMGREGRVENLFTKQQGVIVKTIKTYLKGDIPLHQISNWKQHMLTPRYAEWRLHKMNAVTRSYVSLISKKTIPAHLEKTYIRHNATWRPIFRPETVYAHGGVHPLQQRKIMNSVHEKAVWFRKQQLARRKGGKAKFGSRSNGVWNFKSGTTAGMIANVGQSGDVHGIPTGPPL